MVSQTNVNLTRETKNGEFYLFGSKNVPIECESKEELELIYNAIQKLGEYEKYIQYPENIPHIIGENKRLYDENVKIGIENHNLCVKLDQYRWVPVSERLPDKDGKYDITYWACTSGRSLVGDDVFENNEFIYWGKLVVAWRPLSKPYAPEEKR